MESKQVGPYRIVSQLGEGGLAAVYLAEQLEPIKRQVAIKMIKPGMDSAGVVKRFESERQSLAMLEHPNIASVFDAGVTAAGLPYFVMEVVHGQSIAEYCDSHKLTTRQRLRLFIDVCAAVQHAHIKGLIHRDIKSSNVLVADHEGAAVVKVIDFGIAKATSTDSEIDDGLTRVGTVVGTPQFMSPEQLGGGDIDTRVDVYALGILLYELLVGAVPVDVTGLSLHALAYCIREKQAPTPSTRLRELTNTGQTSSESRATDSRALIRELAGDLDWIVMKAIEKDRERRYETVRAFADDIDRYLAHQPVAARPPSTLYVMQRFVRRNRVAVVAGIIAVSGLILGAAAMTLGFLQARDSERTAIHEAETSKQIADFLVSVFEVSDPSEALGESLTAREVLENGVAKIDSELGDQPAVQSTLKYTMAEVYKNLGLYNDAQELSESAVKLVREQWPESLQLADVLDQLGSLKAEKGDIEGAETLHIEALSLRRELTTEPNAGLANTLQYLAVIEYLKSNLEESKAWFLQAVAVAEEATDASTDLVTTINGDLGVVYSYQGDEELAEWYKRRAWAVFREAHGELHPRTATLANNLAITLKNQGKFSEAAVLYENALTAYQALYGTAHPNIANTMNNLALARLELGEIGAAIDLQLKSLAMFRDLLGGEHAQVATAKINLGRSYVQAKRYEEAEQLQREALATQRRALAPDHMRVGIAQTALAITLNHLLQFDEASLLAESGYGIFAAKLGADHWRTGRAASILGKSLVGLGRYEEAEPLLVPNYAPVVDNLGSGSVAAREIADSIIWLYESWGKAEKAARFLETLDATTSP